MYRVNNLFRIAVATNLKCNKDGTFLMFSFLSQTVIILLYILLEEMEKISN